MDDITTFRHMGLTRFDPGVHLVCREFLQSGQRGREIRNSMVSKRTIEVDKATAAALEARAAELGLSVSELLAEIVAAEGASAKLSLAKTTELDRQWAAIKAGEQTVSHDNVVRWLDTWGTQRFRSWKS
jgi:predicted transcriptional regulator